MSKDMLGVSVHDARGVVSDLLEKLGGAQGQKWLIASKRFLRKEDPWPAEEYAIAPTFARDMTKEGRTPLEDTGEPGTIVIPDLELVSFLKRGESYISGDEMVKRAEKQGANLGQRHAELLLEHQDEIPEEFRDYYLVFPGTIWRDRDGRRSVPYLNWVGGRWGLRFYWLVLDWHSYDRLVRPRK